MTGAAFRARRAVWNVRRQLPRAARPISRVRAAAPPRRPVIVLGCPRSGTSMLFAALVRSPDLAAVHAEHHVLWEEFNHPRRHGWDSNALAAADVGERERAYVYTAIRLFARAPRFLDKTPKNTLRVAYLDALFPDAVFVFLRRRAADTVNSLIEGWRARPRYVAYRLPEPLEGLGPLSGDRWSFALVPGWRELRRAPLEEICACQYVACNEAVLEARRAIAPERFVDVAYEELAARPAEEVRRVADAAGVTVTPAVSAFAASLAMTPVNALTPPAPDKWRRQNPDLVRRVLPLVERTERRLGYEPAEGA